MKTIQLKVPKPVACNGVVRISRDAEEVVRDLQWRTGLPASQIISQIILQAADQIETVREEE